MGEGVVRDAAGEAGAYAVLAAAGITPVELREKEPGPHQRH